MLVLGEGEYLLTGVPRCRHLRRMVTRHIGSKDSTQYWRDGRCDRGCYPLFCGCPGGSRSYVHGAGTEGYGGFVKRVAYHIAPALLPLLPPMLLRRFFSMQQYMTTEQLEKEEVALLLGLSVQRQQREGGGGGICLLALFLQHRKASKCATF